MNQLALPRPVKLRALPAKRDNRRISLSNGTRSTFPCLSRREFGLTMVSQRVPPTSQTDLREKPLFARFARWVERQVGRSSTFVLAIVVVLLWAALGPLFGWSDTWQLVINTGTTIVTFLMVFVIQNTQSRDTQAMQLKLDELIRVNQIARNSL